MRVAYMNDARQITLASKLEMRTKYGALYISRREHTKVVQPKLPNRYDLWLSRHLAILYSYFVVVSSGIARVPGATRNDNPWMRLSQWEIDAPPAQTGASVSDHD